jgi:hypothetical protein
MLSTYELLGFPEHDVLPDVFMLCLLFLWPQILWESLISMFVCRTRLVLPLISLGFYMSFGLPYVNP